MASLTNLSIRSKIRTRLNIIEKNVLRHLNTEKVNRVREHIRKQLDIKNNESIDTGIAKPTLFSKNIFNK
jgi:hypothetical protein